MLENVEVCPILPTRLYLNNCTQQTFIGSCWCAVGQNSPPPYISTGFFEMPVHRTVGEIHTIFSENEFFYRLNSSKSVKNPSKSPLIFGWRAWKSVMRSKRCEGFNGIVRQSPHLIFRGEYPFWIVLVGCRSDCSTVPRQFTKKIFRIMRNEYYTALSRSAV